jgi:hypothetical protein
LLPPLTKRPWWQELNFGMSPYKAQSDILQAGPRVWPVVRSAGGGDQSPSACTLAQGRPVARGNFMMSEAVMVGDAELAKDVLACAG